MPSAYALNDALSAVVDSMRLDGLTVAPQLTQYGHPLRYRLNVPQYGHSYSVMALAVFTVPYSLTTYLPITSRPFAYKIGAGEDEPTPAPHTRSTNGREEDDRSGHFLRGVSA